jgi:phosphoglycerate kinase
MKRTQTIMPMNKLNELSQEELSGQTVFVRAGLNAPIEDGHITTDFRLQSLLPTINYLREAGAKTILAGHLSGSDTDSFARIHEYFQAHGQPMNFIVEYADGAAQSAVDDMKNGDVMLFENLRQHEGEKANDGDFARMLADYADLYVNEAFPAAHREHASIVGVPQFLPAYAGLQFAKEVKHLSRAFNPDRPFVFILGGAKFATKLPLVEKFAGIADDVFVGGALANAYLNAAGYEVGNSRLPDTDINVQVGLESQALHLPCDVVCEDADGKAKEKSVDEIDNEETIVDVGSQTIAAMENKIGKARMVVWNGPLGWYEKGYTEATDQLADKLARGGSQTILGGGDTAAVVLDDKAAEDFSFVSTAGGAMIQFLANETLPGIEAIDTNT